MKNSLIYLALLFLFTANAQSPLEKSMRNYYINYLPEKVFLHTDKNIYAGGESIWMAVYLVDGQTHRPGTFSNTVRVELHDMEGQVVGHQVLRSEDGHTDGEIKIPASVAPGNYQLTAFTNYQRNSGEEQLFRKTIQILAGLEENGGASPIVSTESLTNPDNPLSKIMLRFFPEGGECINDVFCRVAIAAEDAQGHPVQMEAILKDETGTEVTQFSTDETGMGSFVYLPASGKNFQATIKATGVVYDLPTALEKGYYLGVVQRKEDVRISIKTSSSEGLAGSRIAIHLRGYMLVDQVIENENQEAVLNLPITDLSPGVHVVTLFDNNNEPAAERLFFIAPIQEERNLTIQTNQDGYSTRQVVNLELSMSMKDVPVDSLAAGRISLSVVPENILGSGTNDDIRTWLLLNSDLSQLIPNAPNLLNSSDPKVREGKIDEYLMTRGWRRFRWDMTGSPDDFKPDYLLEKGILLRGRMAKFNAPQKSQSGTVILTRPSIGYMEETETDEQGSFIFGPYNFQDTIDVMLQGRFSKGKKGKDGKDKTNPYTHLEISPYDSPVLPPAPYPGKTTVLPKVDNYESLSQQALTIARNYDSLSILLDVVDIKASRITAEEKARKERTFLYGDKPDSRLNVADMAGSVALGIFDLFRKVPGVRVVGSPGGEVLEIRGQTSIVLSSEPAYYVDGMPTDITYIRTLQTFNIDFIDVIRGNRAAFLGSGGTNGAVMIYTKQGPALAKQESPGILQANIYGYHKVRQFAVFNPNAAGNQNRPDFRTTIHWNGDLRVNETGKVKDLFTTSDQKGKFIIVAQGLRNDGVPFYGEGSYWVE